jgi:hypothetical protein
MARSAVSRACEARRFWLCSARFSTHRVTPHLTRSHRTRELLNTATMLHESVVGGATALCPMLFHRRSAETQRNCPVANMGETPMPRLRFPWHRRLARVSAAGKPATSENSCLLCVLCASAVKQFVRSIRLSDVVTPFVHRRPGLRLPLRTCSRDTMCRRLRM